MSTSAQRPTHGSGPHSQHGDERRNMDGLIYLLNQAGLALAQANQQIEELAQMLKEREDDDA